MEDQLQHGNVSGYEGSFKPSLATGRQPNTRRGQEVGKRPEQFFHQSWSVGCPSPWQVISASSLNTQLTVSAHSLHCPLNSLSPHPLPPAHHPAVPWHQPGEKRTEEDQSEEGYGWWHDDNDEIISRLLRGCTALWHTFSTSTCQWGEYYSCGKPPA